MPPPPNAGLPDPPPDRFTWQSANLTPDQAAELLALGDGLAALGLLRRGRRAGQLSIFNFRLRAASEGGDGPESPLVVLMRAGVFRRHTFFVRFTPAAAGGPRLALSGPLDRRWRWRSDFNEARDRITREPVWLEATGASYPDRVAHFRAALTGLQPSPIGDAPTAPLDPAD